MLQSGSPTRRRSGLPQARRHTILSLAFLLVTRAAGATFAEAQCPCSVFSESTTPANPSHPDPNAVEVGMKFRVTAPGTVTGIRFYKGAGNTGEHVGNLWRADGRLLARATFTGETETGWQQAALASPVQVDLSTTYVVSYFAPNGGYAAENDYFVAEGVTSGPLVAPASADVDGNGVYEYSGQSTFPASTFRATNYWVDVVFESAAGHEQRGAPVLSITSPGNPFTTYASEILRAEGLNGFASADIGAVTAALLTRHDVVILGEMPLSDGQVAMFSDWVAAGGKLLASRPDKKLAPLLGLVDTGLTLADGYILVDTQSGPGVGIVGQTMQYHGVADLYVLDGAQAIASLYSNATTSADSPAVTWRDVGTNGGRAAAFMFDIARSVVYTRQGNPAWAGQERDGIPAIRPNDLFFPDYVNLDKVAIPQADEQQRLLANVIITMNVDTRPIPRFWYLPDGFKAAIVHTLDDHGTAVGAKETFDKLVAASASGCVAEDWTCLRGTAWVYTGIPMTDPQAAAYVSQGFEMGAHAQNGCTVDFTSFQDLDAAYKSDLQQFRLAYPSLPPQATSRFHCIVWSDWATQAKVQLANGIRLSLDYYYWPGSWILGRAGLFTGSGLPMRFADTDGTTIDVYQGVSQLVNENELAYPAATLALLDRALGPEGFYGMFGTHDDYRNTTFLDSIISAAQSRNVPVISAAQALTWLDGRNASQFENVSRSGNVTSFMVSAAAGARNIQAMLPFYTTTSSLSALTRDGAPVSFTTRAMKGIIYAFFPALSGSYLATYAGPPALPPPGGALSLWPATATPSVASASDAAAVELGVKFRADVDGRIAGIRFYKGPGNTGTHVGTLWSESGAALASATFASETAAGWQEVRFPAPVSIAAGQTHVASYFAPNGGYAFDANFFVSEIVSGPLRALASDSSGGNGVYKYGGGFPNQTYNRSSYWVDVLFEQATQVPSSYTIWPSAAVPSVASYPDPAAVELGVKFRADRAGLIAGIRFYKGAGNTGTHVGSLWSAGGTSLASATFASETATGWQEVRFASPVSVAAGTTYVASYYAPNGGYAVDANGFGAEVVAPPLRALASSASGGNGVFTYGGGFPNGSFNGSNYWVDVIFEDLTPASYSLWPSTTLPSVPSFADNNAVELGVRFQADTAGEVAGIRFYKGPSNTGVHVARLWSASGTLLGSATFSNETATGWQEVLFSPPVPIVAGQTYVASYFAPNGGYASDANYFGSDIVSGPLRALASGPSGGNGVYTYGGGFPDGTFNSTNYWVDVVFR